MLNPLSNPTCVYLVDVWLIIYLYIVALPRIIKQPSSTMTEVYNVATFECTARSYGIVSITWRRLNS